MSGFAKRLLLVVTLALQTFLADTAAGGIFDGGSITGNDAGACLFGFAGQDFTSAGVGLGFHHYEEESKFWYGNREQYSVCFGQAFGSDENDFLDTYDKEDSNELGQGIFFDGSYSPWGFTILPGSYVTPGLIWLPSFYFNAGFFGHLEYLSMQRMSSASDELFKTYEKTDSRTNFYLGPSLTFGIQYRLMFLTIFAEGRVSPFYETVNDDYGMSLRGFIGIGIFSLK